MFKTTYFGLCAFIFTTLAPTASATPLVIRELDNSFNYGTHPWDVRPKGNFYATRVDPYRYSKEYFYLHPDRAKSFALHPYFRNEYYNAPVDPQQARYSLNRLSDVKYAEENAYIPQPSWIGTCDNYSFSRPNYRIPPYRYMCK